MLGELRRISYNTLFAQGMDELEIRVVQRWDPGVEDMGSNNSTNTNMLGVAPFISDMTRWPVVDWSNIKRVMLAFVDAANLKVIGEMNTSRCIDFSGFLSGCTSLERLESVDLANIGNDINGDCIYYNVDFGQGDASELRYAVFLNFGRSAGFNSGNQLGDSTGFLGFSQLISWGEGSEENRMSVVRTLRDYSYDRYGAGKDSIPVLLPLDVVGRLTDDEITEICDKGYSLVYN